MVAQERDETAAAAQVDEPGEDSPAVRSPIDVVAQGDDGVVGAGSDGGEQGVERRRAAVGVADGDGAGGHGVRSGCPRGAAVDRARGAELAGTGSSPRTPDELAVQGSR